MLQQYKQLAQLSETLYGGVFLCQVSSSPADVDDASTSGAARLAVLKLVNLHCAMAMLNTPSSSSGGQATPETECAAINSRGLDDPRQEKVVANLLRRTGGHRNVVQYLDDVIVDGVLYFIMEFCSGGDLHEHVKSSGNNNRISHLQQEQDVVARSRVAPLKALAMAKDVAMGLQFLHANQIAHRDLSLENILLQDGVCKIADFGLSTRATRRCTERVGKAYYMAPEVVAATGAIESKTYDPKAADMWSFGIVLFILLTGSPLVPSASQDDKVFCWFQCVGLFGVLDAWGMHHIPRVMRDLLNGLLQVNPRDRYSVNQVLEHKAFTLLLKECPHEMDARLMPMTYHQQEDTPLLQQRRRSSMDSGFFSSLIET